MNEYYVQKAKRDEDTGFLEEVPEISGRSVKLSWPDIGIEARTAPGSSCLESAKEFELVKPDISLRYRPVHLHELGTGRLVGHAEFFVLGCVDENAGDFEIIEALDQDSAGAGEFAELVSKNFCPLSNHLESGDSICLFRYVELFDEAELKGKGAVIGKRLLEYVDEKERPSFIVIQPRPLQYTRSLDPNHGNDVDAQGWATGSEKLEKLIASWGAVKVFPDLYLYSKRKSDQLEGLAERAQADAAEAQAIAQVVRRLLVIAQNWKTPAPLNLEWDLTVIAEALNPNDTDFELLGSAASEILGSQVEHSDFLLALSLSG